MEGTESTRRQKTAGKNGSQEVNQSLLMSNKPLHRFIQREPKSLGIVIVIFGCAELLMGFHLAKDSIPTSTAIYIPFWQGLLFIICGGLSIYTAVHPSKKMVTVCLAMYIVSLLGILVSLGYRVHCISFFNYLVYRHRYRSASDWNTEMWLLYRAELLLGLECTLFTSSLCVSVLLIFLSVIARLALKSTNTQVIVQHIPAPQSNPTSN